MATTGGEICTGNAPPAKLGCCSEEAEGVTPGDENAGDTSNTSNLSLCSLANEIEKGTTFLDGVIMCSDFGPLDNRPPLTSEPIVEDPPSDCVEEQRPCVIGRRVW